MFINFVKIAFKHSNVSNKCVRRCFFQRQMLLEANDRNKCKHFHGFSNNVSVISLLEKQDFKAFLPEIMETITSSNIEFEYNEVRNRIVKILNHNFNNAELRSGITLVECYKILQHPENLTAENVRLANILGWCVELIQTSAFLTKYLIEGTEIRNGIKCWHAVEGIGFFQIEDVCMVFQSALLVIKKYLFERRSYIPILELITDVAYDFHMGKALDLSNTVEGKPQLDVFTEGRNSHIVKYTTACYRFYLPVAVAMHFSDKYSEETLKQVQNILFLLAHIYQCQEDYSDAFRDTSIAGKKNSVGIREGKCTWLVVKALERATPEQREVLEKNYGKFDENCIRTVCDLYVELEIPNAVENYIKRMFAQVDALVQQPSNNVPDELFTVIEQVFGLQRLSN